MPGPRRSRFLGATLVVPIVALLGAAGCAGGAPSAAPTVVPTPAITAAPTPTPTPTPAPTPTRKPPAATGAAVVLLTGRIELEEVGVAITLADGWTSIPVNGDDVAAVLDTLDPSDPLVKLLQGQAGQAIAEGMKLWAFDVRIESMSAGFAPNVNLIAAPSTTLSLETLAAFGSSQVSAYLQEGEELDIQSISTDAGPAVSVSYRVLFPAANGTEINAQGRQLYMKSPTHTLIFTFTCSGEEPAGCPADTEAMIDSLELL